eukprot:TRINITY_DN2833_c0_g1_i1.p1 TRINITY_DN2833_c0_g1~~TRINITY_DN2833_c0_g1_i1.p1  ORF type:complete len:475 (-),score=107.43 TRINITY_DN2833_c0_g1_i1:86-1510(-)
MAVLALVLAVLGAAAAAAAAPLSASGHGTPNVLVFLLDDLGYGDLSVHGHPTIRTPRIDALAGSGVRFSQFLAAAPVCTPSRTGLHTGRLPVRAGMTGSSFALRVAYPMTVGGLPASEVTLATILQRELNYSTGLVGKWHLGHTDGHHPLDHGFEYFYGLPYSNDMGRPYSPLPLYQNRTIIEQPVADQAQLGRKYTSEAKRFVQRAASAAQPFLLHVHYHQPHIPLAPDAAFSGTSERGTYGDVVEEVDSSVGEILDELSALGVADNTLVFFTSDNGPWLTQGINGGSAGLFRDGKGTTWEGALRVPGFVAWPGTIAPRIETVLASSLDVFPTVLDLVGLPPVSDRAIDGESLKGVLLDGDASGRSGTFFYYLQDVLCAVRSGVHKVHFNSADTAQPLEEPLLFNLAEDPSEAHPLPLDEPENAAVVAAIAALRDEHLAAVVPGENQLATLSLDVVPCCNAATGCVCPAGRQL